MKKQDNLTVTPNGNHWVRIPQFGDLPLQLTNQGTWDAFVQVIVVPEGTALESPLEGAVVSPTDSVIIRSSETKVSEHSIRTNLELGFETRGVEPAGRG